MTAGPRIDSYQWSGGREAMLRFGPADGPVVVAALPLLEEANRTRAFVVRILRALAERGIGSVLPDLPGTGESLIATEHMRLANLRAAFAAAARWSGGRMFGLAVRSGALLDGEAELCGRWHLSPQTSDDLLREWRRVAGSAFNGERVEIAGNLLSRDFLDDLASLPDHPREDRGPGSAHSEGSTPSPTPSQLNPGLRGGGGVRIVRFHNDPRPADLQVDGAPLWRRAEPDNDPKLAQLLAADIADWIATCGG